MRLEGKLIQNGENLLEGRSNNFRNVRKTGGGTESDVSNRYGTEIS